MTEPNTCREAVLEAMGLLERRHARTVFGLDEIVAEVMGTWSQWKRSTVMTHVSSHMCRDAPTHLNPDLDRVGRSKYRLAGIPAAVALPVASVSMLESIDASESGQAFEARARNILARSWSVDLRPAAVMLPGGVRKRFDLVSPDGQWVGDAKRYTTLRTPAAKWSTIAEYVWLLQKLHADVSTFIVFGGDEDVPVRWLRRFGALAHPVAFYFIEDDEVRGVKI